MSLTLYVDGERWRTHLRSVHEAEPDVVPVIKGNGYGLGKARLARRAAWLGVDTVAVGQYDEAPDVESRFPGSVLVMTPWRAYAGDPPAGRLGHRIVHTIGRREDLGELIRRADLSPHGPRVVLELLTSMRRFGFTGEDLREAVATAPGSVRVEGISLHLPLGGPGRLAEVDRLMVDVVATDLEQPLVWVSHLDAAELTELRRRWPEHRFRLRSGTGLWLGDRGALGVRATVLDAHRVGRGDPYGYRGRRAPRGGTILVVSGGTAHGIGLEAPAGEGSLRTRAVSLAKGGLDAAGWVRSPYTVDGKPRLFAEPPHMQSSMLFLPDGARVPTIGDEVDVRVRFTATTPDRVLVS